MKRLIHLIGLSILFTGCAGMMPNIKDLHPQGYSKLISSAGHECNNATLSNYSACLDASKMLESNSPQKVTALFISHWEQTAFGLAHREALAGESRRSLVDTMVWGSTKYDAVESTKRIVLPVLKKIYKSSSDRYSQTLLEQIDLIDLLSKSSFDSFREIHTKSMMPSM